MTIRKMLYVMNLERFGAPPIKHRRKFALWSSPPGRAPNCGIPMKLT